MATVVLSAYSIAYPTISNDIRVDIYKQSDDTVVIATKTQSAPHPVRIWNFPGLERTNLIFDMNEVDGSENAIRNLAYFDVQPDAIDGKLVRNDEQLTVGVTVGLIAGNTSIFFDGGVEAGGDSTLWSPSSGPLAADISQFLLSGIPAIGDQVQVDGTFDTRDLDDSDLALDSQGNDSSLEYHAVFSGTPHTPNYIQVYGIVDDINFNILSNNGFTVLSDMIDDLVNRLAIISVSAVNIDGNKISITGTTGAACAATVIHGYGLTPHSFSITATATTTDVNDLIDSLYSLILAENSTTYYYSNMGFNGIRFDGYSESSVFITITADVGTSGNRPDFRGWNINPERRNQPGTMIRDDEYSWDEATGEFRLLIAGDVFIAGEPYNIDFDPQIVTAGGSVATVTTDFSIRIVTSSETLLKSDFSNKIIVEPASDYIELTLPDIEDIHEGRALMIEVSKSIACCVKIIAPSVNIKWLKGSIFILPNEHLRIYRFNRLGIPEIRVDSAYGNFASVGRIVSHDMVLANNLENVLRLDGSLCNIYKYARLWDYVFNLPNAQKIAYSNWGTNRERFSFNSGDNFYIPDRRSLYEVGTLSDLAGTFYAQQVGKHKHVFPYGNHPSAITPPFGAAGFTNKYGIQSHDNDNDYWYTNDGTELAGATQLNPAFLIGDKNRPDSYSTNKYILI